MANRPGSATITMDVDGAESSRRRIETVSDALRDMDRTSLRGLNDQISSVSDGFGALRGTIGAAMGALAAIGGVSAFAGWVKGAIDATDAASDLSQKTGIAIKDLAGLELAFQKGGMEAGDLEATMAKLSNKIVAGSAAFEKLGVGTKQLDGSLKSNKEMLYGLADQFSNMEDGVQKAAIAQEIFGKSGAAMIPMLNEGSKGLREMDEMAQKLGLSLSDEAVEEAGNFNDTLDLLALGGKGVARGIAAELLPTLSSLAGQFLVTMTKGDALKNTAHFLATGLKVLYTAGVAIVEVFSTVGKTVGAAGAQLVSLLQGNFSQAAQIGRMWQEDIGNSWSATLSSLESAWNASGDASVDAMVKAMLSGKKMNATSAEIAEQAKKTAKAHEEEARLLAELSGLSGTFAVQWDQLSSAYSRGKLTLDGLIKAQSDLLAQQPGIKAAADEELKYRNELAKAAEGYTAAYELASDAKAKAFANLQAQKDENEQIGLGAIDLAKLNAVRLESRALRAEENAEIAEGLDLTGALAQKYRDEAAALRELAQEQRDGAFRKVVFDDMKSIADEWKRSTERMGDAITDSLMRGFESGKGFAANMWSTIINMAKTDALTPFIRSTVGTALGSIGVSSTASAATGGGAAGGFASGLGLSGMAASIGTGAMQTAGALLTGQIGFGSTVSAGLSALGTGTLSGITAGLSSVVGALGPIALGIGAVAVLASKAFGRGPKEFSDQQTLNGMLGAGGFTGTMDAEWVKKGGWFSSDKRGVDQNPVGAEFSDGLAAAYSAITKSSAEFAQVLGINADSIASRTQNIKIAMGKDEAANQKAVADFFTGVANTVAGELLPAVGSFSKAGESASATLQRLAVGYTTIDQAFAALSMSFGAVGVSSLEARERLLSAAGGLDAFTANMAGFQQNFLTEAERNAPVLNSVREQLAAMNLAWVDTRDELKEVILALDPSKDGERFASLIKLQANFAQVYPAIDKAAIAARELADAQALANEIAGERRSLQDELDEQTMTSAQLLEKKRNAVHESNRALFDSVHAAKAQKTAAEQVAEFWRTSMDSVAQASAEAERQRQASIAEAMSATAAAQRGLFDALAGGIDKAKGMAASLRDLADSMKLGDLSPLSAAAQYDVALKQLKGASPDNLQAAANAFLEASKNRDEGSLAYARDFAMVQELIGGAAAGKDREAASLEWFGMLIRDRGMDGSHANGLDYVPFDGYRAVLHKGERVQTAAEARGNDAAVVNAVNDMARRLDDALYAIAKHTMNTADRLDEVVNGERVITTKPEVALS